MYNSITDVEGIEVGHFTDLEGATGCTVVIARDGATGGVDVRGSAPGTRETDLLRPMNLVQKVHAVVLSGGSAYGLDAACGAMRWLEEQGIGFDTGFGIVPIVASAVLFDLHMGRGDRRPGSAAGYKACREAKGGLIEEGSIGAGTGATVGKALGPSQATKGGIGTCSFSLDGSITIGALVAVNAFGHVVDPSSGRIMAGPRDPETGEFLNTIEILKRAPFKSLSPFPENTTIAVVATDAILSKEEVNKIAQMGHDGIARAIQPAHTMFDGDTVFALATGKKGKKFPDITQIGAIGAHMVAEAIVRAIKKATPLYGIPSSCSAIEG